jgi:hypothetical protein
MIAVMTEFQAPDRLTFKIGRDKFSAKPQPLSLVAAMVGG